MRRRGAALAVAAGAAAWGTTGTSQAVADLAVDPALVGAARLVAGAVALALVVGLRSGRAEAVPSVGAARAALGAFVVAALALTTYQLTFFGAVDRAGVAVGTVIGIGSAPVLTGLLAWLVDRAVPGRRWWLATVLAVVGCVLVVAPGGETTGVDPSGVALALVAGLAYAVLVLAQGRVVAAGVEPLRGVAITLALSAVPGLLVLFGGDAAALVTPRGLLLVAWLGVVTVGIGHGLWSLGLSTLPAPTVGTLTLAEPLVAATLGVLLLGERPAPVAVLGAGLLVVGLLLVALPRRRLVSAG